MLFYFQKVVPPEIFHHMNTILCSIICLKPYRYKTHLWAPNEQSCQCTIDLFNHSFIHSFIHVLFAERYSTRNLGRYEQNPVFDNVSKTIQIHYTNGDICGDNRRISSTIYFMCRPGKSSLLVNSSGSIFTNHF